MKRTIGHVWITVVLLALAGSTVFAQEERPKFSARVQVSVGSKEGEIAGSTLETDAASYIKRELRSLGDVVISDQDPRYYIEVLPMAMTYKSGRPAGSIAISVVVGERLTKTLAGRILKRYLKAEGGVFYDDFLLPLVSIEYLARTHRIYSGGREDLRSLCERLVAAFDSETIEPARVEWQQFVDFSKEKQ